MRYRCFKKIATHWLHCTALLLVGNDASLILYLQNMEIVTVMQTDWLYLVGDGSNVVIGL